MCSESRCQQRRTRPPGCLSPFHMPNLLQWYLYHLLLFLLHVAPVPYRSANPLANPEEQKASPAPKLDLPPRTPQHVTTFKPGCRDTNPPQPGDNPSHKRQQTLPLALKPPAHLAAQNGRATSLFPLTLRKTQVYPLDPGARRCSGLPPDKSRHHHAGTHFWAFSSSTHLNAP